MKILVIIISTLCSIFFIPANAAENELTQPESSEQKPFTEWLEELRAEAIEKGISAQTLNNAFEDIKPLKTVVYLDRKQPEHKITIEEYLEKTFTSYRIQNGKRELSENRELLGTVTKKYSVPENVIVALWGMETSYGENTGNFNIISALVTLAYDGRRSEFFREELFNALKIMDAEKMSVEDFQGSWAGAFGQCQFMPSSFLKYAVDFDGDGKRDIWYTQADVFASIANYLHSEGWNPDETIEEGSNNFKVLLKWNRSRYFATAIGKLAEAIGG